MIPRRVKVAVLVAFLCHGFFILTGRYHLSYDAFTHMLFANHYAENWFSLWETRWYTGFTVVSYPPLVHQLIAMFIPLIGFDKAFASVLWIVLTLYPSGIYAFSRIFAGRSSASNAAVASALLLPIFVTAHIFGQLPFLASTLTALFAAASLNQYLKKGGIHNFLLSIALITTSMAMHHATLLLQPFLIISILIYQLLDSQASGVRRGLALHRFALYGLAALCTGFLVIYPFWIWGFSQTIQVPIDHLSRHNFLTSPLAIAIFFFPMYGPLILAIPFLFSRWHRRFVGLQISFVFLFILGLGGTTQLPRWIFGNGWEWLTYDRFAFWAGLITLPLFGILFIRLNRYVRVKLDPVPVSLRRRLVKPFVVSLFAATALGSWFTPILFRVQPDPLDMQPIVDFLGQGERSAWRYVTFGFGDQFAYLNLLTTATTIDGSYHTARTLPELRNSGIGQVDTSYWALDGMQAIVPILQQSGSHGVRWGFVNPKTLEGVTLRWGKIHTSPFVPVLNVLGWKKVQILANGVLVFENPEFGPPDFIQPTEVGLFKSFTWGVLPLLVFIAATALGTLRLWPAQSEWVIRKLYTFLVGLLPISLCFWLYYTVGEYSHPRVYFTYDNALFFLSDGVALIAATLWVAVKVAHHTNPQQGKIKKSSPLLWMVGILLLTTLSGIWSMDWRTTVYISIHFLLITTIAFSLRSWNESARMLVYGLCGALVIQIVAGYAGFGLQSTAFLDNLNMKWPGLLYPFQKGASVVQLMDGSRILRSYGTLPHPNILGGFTVITLLGPASLFLTRKNYFPAPLLLFVLGVILILITFSRSAMLGLIVFLATLLIKYRHFQKNRLYILSFITLMTFGLSGYFLRDLLFTRIASLPVMTEQFSIVSRVWLTDQAVKMISQHPVWGVGAGSFVIALSKFAVDGAPMEPVHNLYLLVGAELGVTGLITLLGLSVTIAFGIIKSKHPSTIVFGAGLAGLGMVGLFDHFLWSLAPGRMMLGVLIGLWMGQLKNEA